MLIRWRVFHELVSRVGRRVPGPRRLVHACTITWGSQYTRSVTTIPCGHVPSEVETSRILAIGDEVTNLDVREASWQSLLKISPILANLPDLTRMLPLDRDISELLKYLEAACRRPRNQLIVEPEPVRIERARRISPPKGGEPSLLRTQRIGSPVLSIPCTRTGCSQ